jgi:hypothetical protein
LKRIRSSVQVTWSKSGRSVVAVVKLANNEETRLNCTCFTSTNQVKSEEDGLSFLEEVVVVVEDILGLV